MITQELTKWRLNSYYPYIPILGNALETGQEVLGNLDWMDAEVPGSIYKDLIKNNIIPDPYFELNSLQCEWVSQRWWMYRAVFQVAPSYKGRHLRLNMTGIDYKAHISLNRKKLGVHEGMFHPFLYDITDLVDFDGENVLMVLLEHAPDEMGQMGYTSKTFTQKARFTYRWDFCARLIHLGLYDKVLIEDFGTSSIEYAYIRPVAQKDGSYKVCCELDIKGYQDGETCVEYTLELDGNIVASLKDTVRIQKGDNRAEHELLVKDPQLWWPLGHGQQPLYTLTVRLLDGGSVSDEKSYQVGLRTIAFERCEGASEDSLPYCVSINGKKIFLKGINLAPIDQIYGGLKEKDYDDILSAARDANINFLRVNGVGFIESEMFYDLCDRYGIMVWQDFIQSSSGIDNLPSTEPAFLDLLRTVAVHAVKVKRNHVSLTMWCGGNELREVYCTQDPPVTYKNKNIAMLNDIVHQYDKDRIMMPSTASGPNEFLRLDQPGQNHDVHGPWKYDGVVQHYKTYNESDALFHSEFGTDGMGNYDALTKFLSPEHIKAQPFSACREWRNHGDLWCTYDRDAAIFGEFKPEEIREFIKCSQFIQADALRYSYEANRRRMFACSGSMAWQLNEPWPNVSNTCIFDYYRQPKMGYFYVKDALEPQKATLRYDKLVWEPGETFCGQIFMINESEEENMTVDCTITDEKGNVRFEKTFSGLVPANGVLKMGEISLPLEDMGSGFVICLKQNGSACKTEYVMLMEQADLLARRRFVTAYYDAFMAEK